MCLTPISVKGRRVACGHCIECQMLYSSVWAFRIGLEAQSYKDNCFITLTYNEDNRPKDDHLSKRDLQLFIKRLRKHFKNAKIRYFACGEYGSKKGRPHYHVILFNCKFDDLYFWCLDNKKTKLYRSPTLEKLWTFGFSTVGELTDESAKYCAKYLQKIPADNRPRPFILMSKKPGIGFNQLKLSWAESDKMYLHGKSLRLPRYFLDVLERQENGIKDKIKLKREKNDIVFSFVNNGQFDDLAYQTYLENRIKKFEVNFQLDKIIDSSGKKSIIKNKLEKAREKNRLYYQKSVRDSAVNFHLPLFYNLYKKFYKKLLTRINPCDILNEDLTMRKMWLFTSRSDLHS